MRMRTHTCVLARPHMHMSMCTPMRTQKCYAPSYKTRFLRSYIETRDAIVRVIVECRMLRRRWRALPGRGSMTWAWQCSVQHSRSYRWRPTGPHAFSSRCFSAGVLFVSILRQSTWSKHSCDVDVAVESRDCFFVFGSRTKKVSFARKPWQK